MFQGEGGTLESLLAHTASVTTTLASRRPDHGGELIDNLNEVLVTLGNRDNKGPFGPAHPDNAGYFVGGLSQDREAILGGRWRFRVRAGRRRPPTWSPASVPGAPPATSKQLLPGGGQPRRRQGRDRPGPAGAADQAGGKVGRTAIYGSWFNFYLCNFKGQVRRRGGCNVPLDYNTGGARCDLDDVPFRQRNPVGRRRREPRP